MDAYVLSDLSPKLKELEVLTDGCSKCNKTRIFGERIFINEVYSLQELSTLQKLSTLQRLPTLHVFTTKLIKRSLLRASVLNKFVVWLRLTTRIGQSSKETTQANSHNYFLLFRGNRSRPTSRWSLSKPTKWLVSSRVG